VLIIDGVTKCHTGPRNWTDYLERPRQLKIDVESDVFPIKNYLRQTGHLSLLLLNFALQYATRKDWNWMEHFGPWSVLMMLMCWTETQVPWRCTQICY